MVTRDRLGSSLHSQLVQGTAPTGTTATTAASPAVTKVIVMMMSATLSHPELVTPDGFLGQRRLLDSSLCSRDRWSATSRSWDLIRGAILRKIPPAEGKSHPSPVAYVSYISRCASAGVVDPRYGHDKTRMVLMMQNPDVQQARWKARLRTDNLT
ncbi:hypothetical protein GCM10009673_17440 [Nesterenkonia sandarakina]